MAGLFASFLKRGVSAVARRPSLFSVSQPELETFRFQLRPFLMSDARRVVELVNTPLIADMTANIPYPYSLHMAEDWISSHYRAWVAKEYGVFAIQRKSDGQLVGACSLMGFGQYEAEIGYWIGAEYWGQGVATEAAREILKFAQVQLGVTYFRARHLVVNPASGRVLEKLGFRHTQDSYEQIGLMTAPQWMRQYELKV